ncbi:MAG: hypothetical protein CK424_03475 [Legionella sp.]|nr:MAG: hypothetical protein CK424_03475 [Legionella sp.]
MKQKLDLVQQDVEAWSEDIAKIMSARADDLKKTKQALDQKIKHARAQLHLAQKAYSKEKLAMWSHPSTFKKQQHWHRVVDTLEKVKILMDKLQDSDKLKHQEMVSKRKIIAHLTQELDSKRMNQVVDTAADEKTYQRIEKCKEKLSELRAGILANTQRIARYQHLVEVYDSHSHQFPGHWLEVANAIIEQQDFYGFKGTIDHKDRNTTVTPGTGLEGYSVAYGVLLKPGTCIRYTIPESKILIERDSSGKIVNKTDPTKVSQAHQVLAAIKLANLLLLDRALGQEQKIHLRGPQASREQALLVVAALLVEAERNKSMALDIRDIEVDIVDWSMSAVEPYKAKIKKVIDAHHAQDELGQKIKTIKDENNYIVDNEPIHEQSRRPRS